MDRIIKITATESHYLQERHLVQIQIYQPELLFTVEKPHKFYF